MKIHGTTKGGALSKKDFGVAFGGNGVVAVSQLLEAYVEYGALSTTNDLDDTFTSGASGWTSRVSGIEATFAEGSYDDTAGDSDEGAQLGLTDVQGTYCDGFELYAGWNIAGTGATATPYQSVSACGQSVSPGAVTVTSDTRFRIVKTSSNIKYYYDLDGDDSWTLRATYTATIPTLYLAVTMKASGHVAVWSSVE